MTFLKLCVSTGCIVLLLMTGPGCRQKVKVLKSPPHYNFSAVYTDKLDLKIREISGIAWDNKNNEFLVHHDESGKLFFLDKETKLIKSEVHFAGKGDYEDVAIAKGSPYVLRSDGSLTKLVKDSSGKYFGLDKGKIGLSGTNDFETLYYDEARKALVMICKNCAMDDKNSVSAFAYYPDSTGFDSKPLFTINVDEVRKMAPQKASKLQPSAAAIHPVLNLLFIISSASNQLVIADRDGNVSSVFHLSQKLFPQPEGITFKHNGDMYISNEGVAAKSTLLKFLYKP